LKSFREEVEKQKRRGRSKKKSEIERNQIQYNKELEKLREKCKRNWLNNEIFCKNKEKETEKIIEKNKLLTTYKLEGEILKAATRY